MKAIIVGRHKLSGEEGVEIVSQENINFPATSQECHSIIRRLLVDAVESDAALVFQMMPGQVAVACANIIGDDTGYKIGVIVSKPGARPAGVQKTFGFAENMVSFEGIALKALKFINPRSKLESDGVGNITITVDPPLRFEFSHIEWF